MRELVWGTATSAYQIEGGRTPEKGTSIWDTFAHTPGRTREGDTGDVACDHFHRFPEDVALMRDLGADAYRFSIAWTRVVPDGDGEVSPEGLDFYDRLVDELLGAGIAPYVTLYHWDLPQALQDRGGWTQRSIVDAFAHYAEAVSTRLGDRVGHWMTHNEPWVASMVGHLMGAHAPGHQSWDEALAAAHHILLSHGMAVPILRANSPDAEVGIALDCRPSRPATDDQADVDAQRHFDGFRNRWFFDPVFGKGYPADMVDAYRERGRFSESVPPFVVEGDLDTIAVPIDFLGLNYYTSIAIRAGADETEDTGHDPGVDQPDGVTEMGWPVTPTALGEFLHRIQEEWNPPSILVTENGASYSDGPDPDGVVADDRRIEYLDVHIEAILAARAADIPVDGYFVWSLLDNFEWSHGYSQRFGIVWVDHETQQRIPKASFDWYRDRIAASRAGSG